MSLDIKKTEGANAVLTLSGQLDAVTAPELAAAMQDVLATATTLVLDIEDLSYISSAGLRTLLVAQRTMSKKGGMKLTHVSAEVMEVFDITGFSSFLIIE